MRAERVLPWQDRLSFVLLLLLLAATPWPWGGVGALAQACALLLTGLGLCLSLAAPADAIRWPRSLAFRLGVTLWVLWLAALAFSLLSLPEPWLAALSPTALDLHAAVADIGGIAPANTLSVEPSASKGELLSTLGLFGLYLLAARSVSTNKRRLTLLSLLALVAGAQAFYGVGMTLTGSEIGFFERKQYGIGWATGTFVNRNHFAHLMALGGAASLALLLVTYSSQPSRSGWRGHLLSLLTWAMSPALVWRVLLLVLLSAVVLSQSRMGNVVFLAAIIFGVLAWTFLHNRRQLSMALLLLSSFAAADLWVVNRYYGLERVVQRLDSTELGTEQRTIALRDLRPLLNTYALTGSGGGSFQSVFLSIQSDELVGRYDHAHNEYVEFAVEYGLPGLSWMLLMGLLHSAHSLRLLRYRRSSGARALGLAAATALLAAALHAATDFILHIPALRIWLVALLGAVAGATAKAYASKRRRGSPEPPSHDIHRTDVSY